MKHREKRASVANTARHELIHIGVNLALAFFLFAKYGSVPASALAFAVGMFVDGDHMFDYILYLWTHKKKFSITEFLDGSYFGRWQRFIGLLHSWEMVAVIFYYFLQTQNYYLLAISSAAAAHYLVDNLTNGVNAKAYFLLYRLLYGFKKNAISK